MIQKNPYKNCSDEEVIALFRKGEISAVDYLLEKYKNLVRQKARTLFLMGGDNDDLIQEGMIGLYKAIRDYNPSRDSAFKSFANLCITRQMYSAIKASNRKKNMPLNSYVSLYAPAYPAGNGMEEKENLVDLMAGARDGNPEELIIDKESTSMIEYELDRRLSKFEKKVMTLYLDGMTYVQIADALGKEPKSIDNALQRVKSKLSRVLKDR